MENVELWGGVECSCRRIGNDYSDQLTRSGHRTRLSDLDLFADLGLRRLRYPILWEHVAPESLSNLNWAWADERLGRLQELQMEPIVGLVHHGSGPRYTALHEDSFATGLACYARLVAERYPWLNYYTPINEPLTTARFSGLYGIWYPHGTDDRAFVRMQLNQIRATKRAMQAIRCVNPQAKLVQTEDLGRTHSTPRLAQQAEFENHRRWLTFDLLEGRVDRHHPLWNYLRRSGATSHELLEFVDDPLPADIIGINHYVTSERFLDEQVTQYPPRCGQERGHAYADVEAVRVCPVELSGIGGLLTETWERYQRPMAITEAHLNCTREEQMRWLQQTWDAAQAQRAAGVDVRAVTVWSLLGAYDWDSLLTNDGLSYESGAFDVRNGHPRPTALSKMMRHLAQQGHYQHPVLQSEGWWNRDMRFEYHHLAQR